MIISDTCNKSAKTGQYSGNNCIGANMRKAPLSVALADFFSHLQYLNSSESTVHRTQSQFSSFRDKQRLDNP